MCLHFKSNRQDGIKGLASISKFYQDYYKTFKAAHPDLKGNEIQDKVNSRWSTLKTEIKGGDVTNFNEEMNSLKLFFR